MTAATLIAGMTLAASTAGDPGWTPQTELDCKPFAAMAASLKQRYGQEPLGGGPTQEIADPDAGALMIMATRGGESWTLVILTGDGRQACVGAFGHNWQQSLVGHRMPTNLPSDGKPRMD